MKFKYIYKKAGFFSLLFLLVTSCRVQKSAANSYSSKLGINHSTNYCKALDRFIWHNDYYVINNQWGLNKVKKGTTDICLYEYEIPSDTLFGWTFSMPKKAYGVVAYPEIFYGTGFWNEVSTTPNLVQINKIKELQLDYTALLNTNGQKMNLAMDIWVLNSQYSLQKSIHTEIMIWEYQDRFKPNGKKVGIFNSTEGQYEVRIGNINRKSMGLKWQYVAFKRINNRTQGRIPITEMLDYLLQKNIISKEYYIAAIEMGTELSNASGSIYFTKYDLQLQKD